MGLRPRLHYRGYPNVVAAGANTVSSEIRTHPSMVDPPLKVEALLLVAS